MEQAPQLVGFTLQQGIAVALCIAIALVFGWAVLKLFQLNHEDRDKYEAKLEAAHAAAAAERAAQGQRLDGLAQQLATNTDAMRENTRAILSLGQGGGQRAA